MNSLQRSTRRWLHIDDEGKIRAAQWAPDKLLQQATKSADDDDDNEPQHHDDTAPRNGIREWLWTVTTKPESSRLAWFYSYLMVVVIMLSTVTFVVATLPQFRGDQGALTAFAVIETIVIQVFLLDYLVRLCTCEYGYASEWKNKLRFVVVSDTPPTMHALRLHGCTGHTSSSSNPVRHNDDYDGGN